MSAAVRITWLELPGDMALDAVQVQLTRLTAHQLVPKLYLPAKPRVQRCESVNQHASGHRGKRCTYAASHEVDGVHLCWTHAKIHHRDGGVL